eukprot:1235563-Prymnesium_polylepis.1
MCRSALRARPGDPCNRVRWTPLGVRRYPWTPPLIEPPSVSGGRGRGRNACTRPSREPALEVGECPLTRHRPQVKRVTHTGTGRLICVYSTARGPA